ncbi:uncharacterized protein LOC105833313 [Monomorium pharaonis]|uniref:uncharacterized protein LOC105833313 n=1 Tax=Monomorium pharaonis TaxID=307658 RepID=UPI00102E1A6F|nr:uncharacterized protein LOC105833313 [Monomorium pharaonis]
MLAKLSETPSGWDHAVEKVEYALNNTISRATNNIPSRLLFGLEQKGPFNDAVREKLSEDAGLERDLESMRDRARASIERAQCESTERYNLRRKAARRYQVGDYVEIRNSETAVGINKKLIPKFKGPYVVKRVLDFDRYVVADIDGFQLTQRPYTGVVAPDQMRPYLRP